jgi:replicative DNA helicase
MSDPVPSNFWIDPATGGIKRGEMIVFAAARSTGKTQFLETCAREFGIIPVRIYVEVTENDITPKI